MNNKIGMFLPPYLQKLGYSDYKTIQQLSEKSFTNDQFKLNINGLRWRGILEYLACFEYSVECINSLPKGFELYATFSEVKAKFYSASLIFYCQATLDAIAVWLNENYSLKEKGSNIGLSKGKFQNKLIEKNSNFGHIFEIHGEFLNKLFTYRMDWIHRIVGGAIIGGKKNPNDPTFNDEEDIQVMIPLDSSFSIFTSHEERIKKAEEIRKNNDGEYLHSINDFSEYFLEGTKSLIFAIIDASLELMIQD